MARDATLLTIVAASALAFKFLLVFRININWDEFLFLSQVHDFLRGSLTVPLQTLHVHLFWWLPDIATGEIGQILAARLVMAGCATASALLLYGIARRFLSRCGALFGLMTYLSVTAVVEHGTSFRTDPIATFLVLLSLFLIIRTPGGPVGAALAGAAMAVAMLITIKTAFYVVVVGAVIWCLVPGLRDRARFALAFAGTFGLVCATLYLAHSAVLAPSPPAGAVAFLRGSASKVFLEDGLFPRWAEWLVVVAANPLFWFLAIQGAVIARSKARRGGEKPGGETWLSLVLALPLLTPLFYRNAFAYYYVFILPLAAVLVGLSYERYRRKACDPGNRAAVLFVALLVMVQCGFLMVNNARKLPDAIEPQRVTLDAVHAVFPAPVPYIDGYGVVASFPRTGFFMSSWGVGKYRDAGEPVFRELVAKAQPPLLLADSPSLYAALVPGVTVVPERELLPADIAFLKDNYLQHWGMIFVAGKQIELPASGENVSFEIVVGGDYRLEASASARIDGRRLEPGGVVTLATGIHSILAGPATGHATLRWAGALPPPASEPTDIWAFFSAGS